MPEFLVSEVLDKRLEVSLIGSNEYSNIEIGVLLQPESKVVCLCEDFDAIGDAADPAHQLLVGRTGRPPTPDLAIKASRDHE